jgi:lysophospholipid acyltransferase (LPLAT)-like uncharacterized protein
VPVGLALSRFRRLRSWDRSVLPLPFGRVVLALGKPLYLPPAQACHDGSAAAAEARTLAEALEATSTAAARALTNGSHPC